MTTALTSSPALKTFDVSASLQPLLEQMSADTTVPVEGLVNQALSNWAKLHGYAATPTRRAFLVMEASEVELEGERFVIGRDVSCNFTIESPRLSRQHLAFSVRADGVEVLDLGSSNGTWFNGERIMQRVLLDGDELQFGDVAARIELR